jgi:hypothetical protein
MDRSGVVRVGKSDARTLTPTIKKVLEAPTTAELRAAIRSMDGHADVWRLFADSDLFGHCVLALVLPNRNDDITHVAAVESRGFVLGGAAATALGAGFVAIRKAAGHLPGDLFYEQPDSDYKGAAAPLRLQADVLGTRRAGARGRRLVRDRQSVSRCSGAAGTRRRDRGWREHHRGRNCARAAAAAGQVPGADSRRRVVGVAERTHRERGDR